MAPDIELALDPDKEYEIVDGVPEEKVMGGYVHCVVGIRLASRLWLHADARGLGAVSGPDGSFAIRGNERMPDIAFVAAARMPPVEQLQGTCPVAPDLAVEILSPHDLYARAHAKLREYFAAGVREVWLVDPAQRSVTTYPSPTRPMVLTGDEELASETLLPGFRCRISDLFRGLDPAAPPLGEG